MKPALAVTMEIMGEELDRLDAEIDQLNSQIDNQQNDRARRLVALGYVTEATNTLAAWLGESHADLHLALEWMERVRGNLPPEFKEFIKEARANLTKRQNAFLKEFGDMNEPGEN